jgi:serine/threonine protein kinase
LNPHISQQLSRVIEKAMALDPAQRYQNAAEFKSDLQACLLPNQPVSSHNTPPASIARCKQGKQRIRT